MQKVLDTARRAVVTLSAGSPWISSLRTGLVALVLAVAAFAALPRPPGEGADPSSSLRALLEERHGLLVDEGSVHWIDAPGGGLFSDWYVARASVLARACGDSLRDLYLVHARVSPSGRVASARPVNLTMSFNASEQAFVARGPLMLLATMMGDGYGALELIDFGGEDEALTGSWPLVERIKNAVTNFQETGQACGVERTRYELFEPSAGASLEIGPDQAVAVLDAGTIRIPIDGGAPLEGADLAAVIEPTKAMSGHVAWLVDTVRAVPLVGKDKIGWLESRFYGIKDVLMRAFYSVAGEGYAAREIEEDMGLDRDEPYVLELPGEMGEMHLGWPPPDVPPDPAMEPLESEGRWQAFTDERFTRRNPGHPFPFVTTVIRPDPERTYASIKLIAWDPRMVEIHMQAGVVEPRSDTGKAGTGMIPRDDGTMGGLLAAFNGGFQALHGEFGMMQEGRIYLPPKPWAATVARLRGGRIGFGTWPGPDVGDVPAEILSYRQNLTPLIQDSVINPYKRHWWGSSPDLDPDSPTINRSAICWTSDDHVLYGLAQAVNEYTFAEGFRRAGCHYMIQLDVNSGHSGLEYYRVDPRDQAPPAGELDRESEAEGEVRDGPGLLFRARKFFRSMVLMRFPRFIQRDPRDYFYLTLARLLPGPDIQPPGGGDPVPWRVKGLPGSTSYPARFTMATLRPQGGAGDPVHVVQADPRWLGAGEGRGAGAVWFPPADLPRFVAGVTYGTLAKGDHVLALVHDEAGQEWIAVDGRWMEEVLPAEVTYAFAVATGDPLPAPLCGAFGLGPDRFVSWAETPGGDPQRLSEALLAAGAERVLGVPATPGAPCGWAFRYADGEKLIPLVSEELREAEGQLWGLGLALVDRAPVVRLFPDTEVVKPGEWNPGQTKRIRYFRPEEEPEVAGNSTDDSAKEP